jgi:RNA polymerase sigma-70 factor (ECF subfamily)
LSEIHFSSFSGQIVSEDAVESSGGKDETSSTLLARVQGMDTEAWQRFSQLYGPLVYRWCRRAGLQEADAGDVGSKVFEAVFRHIGSFSRTQPGASLRGWLYRITQNKIRDSFRVPPGGAGEGGEEALQRLEALPAEPIDERADAEDDSLLLQRALELIRPDFEENTWQAFRRMVMDEQSAVDVAKALGLTTNAVYLAVARVKRRLRQEYEGILDL